MPFPLPRRWLVLGGALLATSVAAMWPRAKDDSAIEVVAPVERVGQNKLKSDPPSDERARLQPGSAVESVAPSATTDKPEPKIERNLSQAPHAPAPGNRLERLRTPTKADDLKVEDLFGATNWNPPPPPPPPQQALPPPVPTAPPFPYAVAGSIADLNGPMVVFMKQNQDFVVRVGDVLENTYRVDAIDEQSVTVTYLPLNLKQVVALSAPK